MTRDDGLQAIARYRPHLSFFIFIALALEWQLNGGGRPHPLLSLAGGVIALPEWWNSVARGG